MRYFEIEPGMKVQVFTKVRSEQEPLLEGVVSEVITGRREVEKVYKAGGEKIVVAEVLVRDLTTRKKPVGKFWVRVDEESFNYAALGRQPAAVN